MRFSERYGYKKVRDVVQINSIDEPLLNALWNILKLFVWDNIHVSEGIYRVYRLSNYGNEEIRVLCDRLWHYYFKKPLDQLDDDWTKVYQELREYFFRCEWYEIYDFLEFVVGNYERHNFKDRFIDACNDALEREVSAYRFVNGVISRITEREEIEEVDRALETALGPVRIHLRRALELLSSREAPDYRNSIKESISAVESLVAVTVGVEKGTLGQLIKKLDDEIDLHPGLKTAFSSLYGYTSDEGGIRHALMESESVKFEDAKFFLVVCSAFINFVEAKVATSTV